MDNSFPKLTTITKGAKNPFPARWSRKGNCPSCDIASGSRHKKGCGLEYISMDEHQRRVQNTLHQQRLQKEHAAQQAAQEKQLADARRIRTIRQRVTKVIIASLIMIILWMMM